MRKMLIQSLLAAALPSQVADSPLRPISAGSHDLKLQGPLALRRFQVNGSVAASGNASLHRNDAHAQQQQQPQQQQRGLVENPWRDVQCDFCHGTSNRTVCAPVCFSSPLPCLELLSSDLSVCLQGVGSGAQQHHLETPFVPVLPPPTHTVMPEHAGAWCG